jgi:hypothetical protein
MSPSSIRAYNLQDFIGACSDSAKVFVTGGAMQTAESDFGLKTMNAVIKFIANEGLEDPKYINTKDWENNKESLVNPIKVDAYSFFSGPDFGYMAFLFNPKTQQWIIKSFKVNENTDPRSLSKIAQRAKERLK